MYGVFVILKLWWVVVVVVIREQLEMFDSYFVFFGCCVDNVYFFYNLEELVKGVCFRVGGVVLQCVWILKGMFIDFYIVFY